MVYGSSICNLYSICMNEIEQMREEIAILRTNVAHLNGLVSSLIEAQLPRTLEVEFRYRLQGPYIIHPTNCGFMWVNNPGYKYEA